VLRSPTRWHLVNTPEQFNELLDKLNKATVISFDTETKDLYKPNMLLKPCEPIVGVSFAVAEGEGYYVPIRHDYGVQLPVKVVLEAIKPILENPAKQVGGHNIKYDLTVCKNEGIDFKPAWDSMIETHLAGEGLIAFRRAAADLGDMSSAGNSEQLALKDLVEKYFSYKMKKIVDLFPTAKKKDIKFATVGVEAAAEYSSADADFSLRLHNMMRHRITGEFLYKVEMELIPNVVDMEMLGLLFDREYMRAESERLSKEAVEVRQQIMDYCSERLGYRVDFNIDSVKQLCDILFDKLGVPITKKSEKTGNPSTNAQFLEKIQDDWPIVHLVLTYRELCKSAEEFYSPEKGYLKHADENDMIHTLFGTIGASSGRFTSSGPNCQNIARSKEWHVIIMSAYAGYPTNAEFKQAMLKEFGIEYKPGEDLRKLLPELGNKKLGEVFGPDGKFERRSEWKGRRWVILRSGEVAYEVDTVPRCSIIPFKGWKLWEADYDQIESKILAALAPEPTLLAQFERMDDIHSMVAADVLGIPVSQVTKEQRQNIGKPLNHAIPYGLTEVGLAQRQGKTREAARQLLAKYFEVRPAVALYIERVRDRARISKKVVTYFGRIQVVPEFFMEGRQAQAKAERASVNRIIQGTGGDILKIAMVRAARILIKRFFEKCQVQLNTVIGLSQKVIMIHTNHDSLLFMAREDVPDQEVINAVIDAMVFPIKDFPKITITIKKGDNWGKMKEVFGAEQWKVIMGLSGTDRVKEKVVEKVVVEEKQEPVKTTEVLEAVPANVAPAGPSKEIVLKLQDGITNSQAQELVKLLTKYKGSNIILIEGSNFQKRLDKYPTSLTENDVMDFKAVVKCEVFLDRKSVKVESLLA
jgi:DNA polymerase I-like protein with 3'-5' exonuclease and polymerase domains